MLPWFTEHYGNPHSVEHVMGTEAEAAVEDARGQVAALIGADAKELVFTSGATESNNIAIKGAARFARAQATSAAASSPWRPSTNAFWNRWPIWRPRASSRCSCRCAPDGLLDPDALRAALEVPTLLVSVMAVNNEIGVVQDIAALARIAKQAGALFHTDIAQAAGKIPLDLTAGRSIWPRSAATRSTDRKALARSMSAAGRGCGWRRCSPAADRSAACAPARCPRR